jgi:hypothetical protein
VGVGTTSTQNAKPVALTPHTSKQSRAEQQSRKARGQNNDSIVKSIIVWLRLTSSGRYYREARVLGIILKSQ